MQVINKNSRIGVLTFFASENYGAILQCFALISKLKDMGVKAELINYPVRFKKQSLLKRVKHFLWTGIRYVLGFRIKKKKCLSFLEEYLGVCKENQIIDIFKCPEIQDYHGFIVGSDQVWNFDITSDPAFRLDFATRNQFKFSYAASFGKSVLPLSQQSIFEHSLSSFSAISVREASGQRIIKGLGLNASLVLDPTLLFSKYEWLKLLNLNIYPKEECVFCYLLPGNESNQFIINEARKYAKQNGLDMFVIGARDTRRFQSSSFINTAGPRDFVDYICKAKYIFTNSFHGTCFSIIFNKSFSVFLNQGFSRNNRIIELLSNLGLSQQIVYDNLTTGNYPLIDFCKVNSSLESLKRGSVDFLTRIVLS